MTFKSISDKNLPDNIKALPGPERAAFVAAYNQVFEKCVGRGIKDAGARALAIASAATGKTLDEEIEADEIDLIVDLVLDLPTSDEKAVCERCYGELDDTENKAQDVAGLTLCSDCVQAVASNIVKRFDKQLQKHYQPKDKQVAFSLRKERNTPLDGFKLLPNRMWIASYSNTLKDLEGEAFSKKGFEDDIAFSMQNDAMPELWFYHLPVPHGKALYIGLFGDRAIAIGKFHEGVIADKMIAYYKKHPDLAVSHGYIYNPDDLTADGVYQKFHTFEISPLPRGKEANPYTTFNLLEDKMPLNPDAQKELEKAIGAALAAEVLQDGGDKALTDMKAIAGYKAGEGAKAADDPDEDEEKKPKKVSTDDMPMMSKELTLQITQAAAVAAASVLSEQMKGLQAATEKALGDAARAIGALHGRLVQLETKGRPTNPTTPEGQSQYKGLDFQGMLADLEQHGAPGNNEKALGNEPEFMQIIGSIAPMNGGQPRR